MTTPETTSATGAPEPGGAHTGRSLGIGTKILLGMVVGGVAGGLVGPRIEVVQPIGDAFIRVLIAAAIPLVVFNLLAGLTTLAELKTFGRLALKIVAFYVVTSFMALALGVWVTRLTRPGVGMQLSEPVDETIGSIPSVGEVLLDLVPANVFEAMAEGNVGQLVVFAVLLGITTLLLPPEPRDKLRDLYALLAELFRKLVDVILWIAPYGIGALMAVTVGRYGSQLFGPPTRFLVGVWGAQLLMLLLYMAILVTSSRYRPLRFLREGGELWATTLATTSSLASLSVAFDVAEKMKLPRGLYALTLPLGAQLHKDGTAIMLTSVLLFTAQAAGLDFSLTAFASVVLIGFLLSMGSGGIPGGGLVVALVYVQAFGLPLEVAAIVGGIYRLVDMGNTTLNVMGDLVGTAVVARSEERREARESAT